MANPTFTRANTAKGVTSAGVSQNSITPSYTAAAAGGYLVAVVMASSSSSGATCSPPNGNWVQQGSTLSLNNTDPSFGDWLYIYFFQNSSVDASTSAAFSFNTNVTPFAIVYELNSTAGVDTANIFTATTVVNGATVSSGSGTANETNDYQIIGGVQNDSNFTTAAITSFTADMQLNDHGDGGASFGGSGATFHKNAVNSSTTVAAQTINWNNPSSAGSWAIGFTLLMRPVVVAAAWNQSVNDQFRLFGMI